MTITAGENVIPVTEVNHKDRLMAAYSQREVDSWLAAAIGALIATVRVSIFPKIST